MRFQKIWTIEKIKEAIDRFYEANGRYPVADDFEDCDYLPSARQIQRRFGGLPSLRKALGHSTSDFSRGDNRTAVAKNINSRAQHSEKEMEQFLISFFGKHFVHEQKLYGEGKNRFDFYVYAKGAEFGIDVFFARDLRTYKRIINIKEKKYNKTPVDVYLVNVSPAIIGRTDLNLLESNKKSKLPHNIKLVTYDEFVKHVRTLTPLRAV